MENSLPTARRIQAFRIPRPRPLPNRVREYRLRRELTVVECAKAIGVSRQAIYHAELRDRGLSADNWLKLADFLGCDLRALKAPP